ncbi:MAG TPA: hypothetical protein VF658_01365 [Pyrinomonadaceae bacterium]|jgi:lysylphosphatidylglycerol synthetase-like protein (DUF2156 family)
MIQRTTVFVFEEAIDWVDFGFVVLSGVLTYAVAWFFIRRRNVVVEGIELEYQPPKPDVAAFGAVAVSDALIRFVTLRLTTFSFTSLYGGAIPLQQALFIGAFAFLVFMLFSFIVVMLISKGLLPASLRQAALISAVKVSLQLVLWGLFILLQIGYAFMYGER